jgi:hypothetical protein
LARDLLLVYCCGVKKDTSPETAAKASPEYVCGVRGSAAAAGEGAEGEPIWYAPREMRPSLPIALSRFRPITAMTAPRSVILLALFTAGFFFVDAAARSSSSASHRQASRTMNQSITW